MKHLNQDALPKYLKIVESLKGRIDSGKLQGGDLIESINDYATNHNCSKSTVKRAYDQLVKEGYLTAVQGKGFYVEIDRGMKKIHSSQMQVFWSYSHRDDERCGGAITKLRQRIQEEYENQSGNDALIFQDVKDIKWGRDWRKVIEKSLGVTAFFIPIITPSYLKSPSCLSELRSAREYFSSHHNEEGIYPIEFIDSQKIIEELQDDDLVNFLNDTQRLMNWKHLRFTDPYSSEYCLGVSEIVERMLEKEQELGDAQTRYYVEEGDNFERIKSENDEPYIDALEVGERCETLAQAFIDILNKHKEINDIFQSVSNVDLSTPRGFQSATMTLASRLEKPSQELEERCRNFNNSARKVDHSIDAIVEVAESLELFDDDQVIVNAVGQIYEPISQMSDSINWIRLSFNETRCYMSSFARLSKILREPCTRIDTSLKNMESYFGVIGAWDKKLGEYLNNRRKNE